MVDTAPLSPRRRQAYVFIERLLGAGLAGDDPRPRLEPHSMAGARATLLLVGLGLTYDALLASGVLRSGEVVDFARPRCRPRGTVGSRSFPRGLDALHRVRPFCGSLDLGGCARAGPPSAARPAAHVDGRPGRTSALPRPAARLATVGPIRLPGVGSPVRVNGGFAPPRALLTSASWTNAARDVAPPRGAGGNAGSGRGPDLLHGRAGHDHGRNADAHALGTALWLEEPRGARGVPKRRNPAAPVPRRRPRVVERFARRRQGRAGEWRGWRPSGDGAAPARSGRAARGDDLRQAAGAVPADVQGGTTGRWCARSPGTRDW